jgi:MoxR-like ATPase
MFKAVKAMAFLRGKDFVTPVDIAYIAKDMMRHRIVLTYEAEAEGITTDTIIENVLKAVPIP